ncbi:MAG: DNA cytosine methyltransferase [Dichotomicrobium sp.]
MRQQPLPLPDELIVDNFAGGGGASIGIELGIGRPVDVAINHDAEAIAMHRANHPETTHYTEDVWKVDPHKVTNGQPVGLAWFSPDCKHFSKAKGRRPVSKKIRGLAWVVVRWARRVRPRVIMLENVEEFQDWGPVGPDGIPCPKRKGQTFEQFVSQLGRYGYRVEWKQLRACDYGAPTIRKRLFLVARRDSLPIVWPEPTHGDPESKAVKAGKLLPWRTAAECIDWSIPCPSIFERKRPLAENTMKRIARGIQRFVLDDPQPYIVRIGQTGWGGDGMQYRVTEPLTTVTSKAEHCLATPYFVPRHGERAGQEPRCMSTEKPLPTVTATANGASLVAAFMAQHNGGMTGHRLKKPLSTIVQKVGPQALVATHLINQKGSDQRHRDMRQPSPTVCAGGNHAGLVAALMAPYYGSGSGTTGRDLRAPSPTVTSNDRLQLVTVKIDGETYVLTDIGMRMLQPHELYAAQGFPGDYIHDHGLDADGNQVKLTKTAQVRMCGNSVCPPLATALVRANFQHEAEWKQEQAA